MISNIFRLALAAVAAASLGLTGFASDVHAQETVVGEQYIPTIWIDPDGCEHWVMDDGAEGFMTPHRTPDGKPVCRRSEICGVLPTDQLFATDRSNISGANKSRLEDFFRQTNAYAYLVYGHTDSRASDEYNIRLSNRRANAVAGIGTGVGARVIAVKGFGERQPRASNDTAAGMQQNRRVEIYCLR